MIIIVCNIWINHQLISILFCFLYSSLSSHLNYFANCFFSSMGIINLKDIAFNCERTLKVLLILENKFALAFEREFTLLLGNYPSTTRPSKSSLTELLLSLLQFLRKTSNDIVQNIFPKESVCTAALAFVNLDKLLAKGQYLFQQYSLGVALGSTSHTSTDATTNLSVEQKQQQQQDQEYLLSVANEILLNFFRYIHADQSPPYLANNESSIIDTVLNKKGSRYGIEFYREIPVVARLYTLRGLITSLGPEVLMIPIAIQTKRANVKQGTLLLDGLYPTLVQLCTATVNENAINESMGSTSEENNATLGGTNNSVISDR